LGLESLQVWQHLVLHELGGGLRHQPVLVGDPFWREDVGRRRVVEQPGSAFATYVVSGFSRTSKRHRSHKRSKMPAAPMPPPTHMVTSPYFALRRCISCSRVVLSFAPVQPSGCPSAIAPPLTLRRSGSIGSSRRHASTCAANASFSSNRSIWSSERPAI